MDKESVYELQKIDCNCNDCAFMVRDLAKKKFWDETELHKDQKNASHILILEKEMNKKKEFAMQAKRMLTNGYNTKWAPTYSLMLESANSSINELQKAIDILNEFTSAKRN